MAVYKDGRLVRTLFSGRVKEAGSHEEAWDGKDDSGRRQPAGRYELRGLLP